MFFYSEFIRWISCAPIKDVAGMLLRLILQSLQSRPPRPLSLPLRPFLGPVRDVERPTHHFSRKRLPFWYRGFEPALSHRDDCPLITAGGKSSLCCSCLRVFERLTLSTLEGIPNILRFILLHVQMTAMLSPKRLCHIYWVQHGHDIEVGRHSAKCAFFRGQNRPKMD